MSKKVKSDKYFIDEELLAQFRDAVGKHIDINYKSTESFCNGNEIPKSLMSALVNELDRDFRLSTLVKIAEASEKRLVIRLE